MLTNISGADVPRAIKVKPIIKSLMPIFLANIEEFDMNLSNNFICIEFIKI